MQNRRRQRPAWGASHCWQQCTRAAIFGLLLQSRLCHGQQTSATAAKFAEELAAREAELTEELEDGKYVSAKFHPEHSYANTNNYTFAFPRASDYSIGLLIDPCKGNKYDCCVRAYGAPEYPMLLDPDTTRERVVPKLVHAPPGQILSKVNIIDQDGIAISAMNSRFADDEVVVDSACVQNNVPYTACVDFMQRQQRSRLVPPCMDNNETVSGTASCYDSSGNASSHCMAVALSQTALSVVCGGKLAEDPHCGTFLEVHLAAPNEYMSVEAVLAERRITTRNITGYITSTISTTWQGNASRVLCAYELDDRLVGSMVLVTADAPRCCMPALFNQATMQGAFMCPVFSKQGAGPFAAAPTTVAQRLAFEKAVKQYPYCPYTEPDEDVCMESVWSAEWGRHYTRKCADTSGSYPAQCPYFSTMGMPAYDALNRTYADCSGSDEAFSFVGRVGRVVSVPEDLVRGQFGVTFNDGRTTYYFRDEHLVLELDYNYELWWVQRTRSKFIVQKRKPFTVTEPRCTFDTVNNQYYPFAVIDADGNPIE
jgi:hypothetical protein